MKRDVLQSAENYAKAHRSRKRWYRLVAGLACVVVFCTVYALILPAITMTNNPKLEAEKTQADLGDALTLCFSVEPDAGAQQTVFYLSAKQDNAGMDLDFDSQNTARIAAENGTEIQLHRQLETDGTVGYWFALSGEAQAATLKLPWINGAQQIRPASTASQPQSGDTGATAEYTEQTSAAEESSADYVEVPAGTDISETEAPAEPAETAISEEETMGDAPAGETAAAEEAASVKETAAVSAAEPEAAAVKEESAVADAAYGALVYENGDPAEAGSVTLTAGSGATLEEAKKAANDADNSVTLRWQTEQTTDSDKNANTGHKAALPQEVVAEGTISGTEISWSLTKSLSGKYTLTISGTGAMPNYTKGSATPWGSYVSRSSTTDRKVNLVIGEGITSVGQYCFHYCRLASVSLPQSLTRIRGNAFRECLGFTSIEIPANVTVVEGNSFYEANNLKTVVLHEGLQTIGSHAFRGNAITTLELPSTLVNWSNAAVNCQGSLKEITVAEGNPSLAVVDNALYRLNEASETYELVLYASGSVKKALTIPETINGKNVTSIIKYSFYGSSYPKEVTIPSSVNKIETYSFQTSSVGKVTLESTSLSNSKNAFIGAKSLKEIDFSNLQGTIPEMFLSSTAIQTITIPEEVTGFGHNFLSETTYLKNIYYDAKSAGAGNGTPLGTSHCTYTLTIGPHVDTLQKTFYHFAQYAENIAFEGPNQITITEGAMAGAPAPFTDLSGTVYVDGQGLIYLYDQTAGTAELIYCPPEVQQATVSAEITPEDGITCTVTAVRKDALKWAKDLQSIDFEAPDKIERLADYCVVEPGDRVTYRLTLENSGDGYFCLNGADLADALPDNMGVFRWEKDVNLTDFRIETQGDGIAYSNLDQWYLADSYGGLLGDRQYILWPDTASITFHSPGAVYLYFTLTYPEDTETSQDWSLYAAANRGNILDNTMYVYLYPSTVTHDLREMGQVVLQKGVYGLFRNGQSPYKITGNSRLYYNNRDSSSRAIAYYVILYNGGNSRLYLSDLYDKLPNGFSYRNMLTEGCAGGTLNAVASPAKTTGGLNSGTSPLVKVDAEDVVYRSATISAANSGGVLRFSFDAGSGDYAVKYSEEMQQYYLDRGEAIVFGYVCDIGLAENTEDSATNTIAMAYTDYLDSGLTVIDQNSLPVRAAESDTFVDFNDGGRLTKSGLQVQEDYGFGDGGAQTWLISDVTVIRGGIIPGVTKYTESYTNTSNIVAAYTNSVGPYDTVNWRVRLHNSGTLSVTDYVFTDIMPAPYAYEGAVTVKICGADGSSWKSATLLTFPSGRTGAETQLTVTYAGKTVTVPLNGSWVSLDSGTQISMEKDEKGNEVLQIHFADPKMSIPEGGYVDVCLSSRNPTTSYQNTVYSNQAMLTPQAQRFSTVQQGSMVRDAEGNPVGAKNSSPVTVSFGYATTSEKRVTETADESNTAVSTDPENNFILLPQADDSFTYSLVVNNDTEKYMTKLVLIDNLPEVGDHSPFETSTSRGSEFKVSLADTPDFTVTVTTANGDSYTLPSEYYTVQYSTTTDFGGAQSADWKGENTQTTALWTQNLAGARSFRIIITDPEATQIPDQSEIAVTFQARVDGEANPGDVAWNSFGYHYALKDITVELESMPQVVGVKIPSIPEFSKTLMDLSGKPVEAETEETFHFLLYQGPSLSRRYATAEELIQVLNENGYDYRQFDATIPGGQNTSDRIRLSLDPWDWQTGEQYTIVELPTSEDYVFRSFNGSSMAYYTFTYDPAQKRAITCENTYEKWTIRITKESINGEALPGAVFALYSPSEEDQVPVPGEYAGLSVEPTVEVSGQNWYLAGISASGTDGVLEWTDLTRKSYYLLEIKAPDGYHLTKQTGQVLYQAGSDGGVYALTIVNEADYELPETGGDGTTLYTIGGLLLMAVAGILLYMYFKRRKGDVTAS